MRRYSDEDRAKGQRERLGKILGSPAPDYPQGRKPGRITVDVNGVALVVDLIPAGNCTQWLAIFDGAPWKVAGMDKIHTEIRRRMPPLKGV